MCITKLHLAGTMLSQNRWELITGRFVIRFLTASFLNERKGNFIGSLLLGGAILIAAYCFLSSFSASRIKLKSFTNGRWSNIPEMA